MKRSNRGFTLIELLVVIAIIAILMAILMPALQRVRKQAKSVVCSSRLHQWGLFFSMYTDEHNGSFNQGWDVGETTLFPVALRPYYEGETDLLICPMGEKLYEQTGWGPFTKWSREFDLPTGRTLVIEGSYNINSWTNAMTKDRGARKREWFWKNVTSYKGQNLVPVLLCGTWHDAWPLDTDSPPNYDGEWGNVDGAGTSGEMCQFAINRHLNGVVNGLFSDWSVRGVGLKELWTLRWHRNFNTHGPWTKGGGVLPEDWPDWMQRFKDY